jgi:hypothetical protein
MLSASGGDHDRQISGAIRSGDFKVVESYETGQTELFNLEEDIEKRKTSRHPILPEPGICYNHFKPGAKKSMPICLCPIRSIVKNSIS